MSGIADWAKDALFHGALLFDGSDTRSHESIAYLMHEGDRLGVVRQRGGYFRAECFLKEPSPALSVPVWSQMREPTLCGTASESEVLVREFLSAAQLTPSLGDGKRVL
jgi:hypothetical protein